MNTEFKTIVKSDLEKDFFYANEKLWKMSKNTEILSL